MLGDTFIGVNYHVGAIARIDKDGNIIEIVLKENEWFERELIEVTGKAKPKAEMLSQTNS